MSALGTVSLDNMRQLAAHPVVQGINRFGPMVTTVVLVAILAWLFARLVWLLVPGAPDADIEPIATAIPAGADAPAAAANTANVTPIISAHLFGVSAPLAADDEDTVASQDVIDAPETDLPLELKGTLAGNPVEASLAIIKDNGTEKLYGVTGDRRFIRQGVTLHSVHATHVVLNRNGKLESLSLPTASETPAPRAAPRRTSNIRRAPTAQRSMTQVLTQNATQLTQIIQPRPYFVGGQQRG
ncbi:MAG: type II secretion system protein N, partial [Pseudomonadota bacterium]